MKVIFLDFDGVLNGDTKFSLWFEKFLGKIHLRRFYHKHFDCFGIYFYKVFLLACLTWMTHSKVVLSSAWRNAYFIPYKEAGNRGKALQWKFKFWHIPVIGKTKNINGERGLEIKNYLEEHPQITQFVILDDEVFDIKEYFPNQFVQTRKEKKYTGLNLKYIFQAKKILEK